MLLAGPISHTTIQCMDFVEIYNISLDFSYFFFHYIFHFIIFHFSGCLASFVYSCHSVLECYNPFSGVKLSIKLFCFIYPLLIVCAKF